MAWTRRGWKPQSSTGLVAVLAWVAALLSGAPAVGAADADVDPVGVWPLSPAPTVARGFEPPGSLWGPGHRGVDLVGSSGQTVRTALPGVVSFVGDVAGRAVVVVRHGPTRTTYQPVLPLVGTGARVAAGQPIGRLVAPGSHCAPGACLHWGWLRGTTYLDPLDLVGGGPVRLLPLAGLVPGPSVPSGLGGAPAGTRPGWRPLTVLLGPGLQW